MQAFGAASRAGVAACVWRTWALRPLLVPPARSFSHPQRFLDSQARWRKTDQLPPQWELVYRAPMDGVINAFSTLLTVTTSTLLGVSAYCAMNSLDPDQPIFIGRSDVVLANNFKEFSVYIFAFILIHVAVRVLISRYVIRLYKNGDNYLAVFRGLFYNSITKHEFLLVNFKKLPPAHIVPWGESRFELGSKKGILLEDYFKTPSHLYSMLLHKQNKEV